MKRTLYTLGILFIVQALSYATPLAKRSLDGVWHSHSTFDNIRIDENRRALRVRNLFQRGWVRYERKRNGNFRDYYGNVIRVINANELVAKQKIRTRFGSKKFGRSIYLHRNRLRNCDANWRSNSYHQRSRFSDCTSDIDPWYDQRGDHYERGYDRRNNRNNSNRRIDFRLSDAEGTWISNNNEKVRIQRTAQGIKAKIIGRDKWEPYIQDSRQKNVFVNKRGSSYVFERNDLVWTDRKGNERTFKKR